MMKKHMTLLVFFSAFFIALPAVALDITVTNPDGSSVHFDVELAQTYAERRKGMKGREYLPEHRGMLFIFEKPKPVRMWMKNMPVSLDMIFFDEDHTVQYIEPMTQPYSKNIIGPVPNTYTILEVVAGSCDNHGIQVGSILEDRPS